MTLSDPRIAAALIFALVAVVLLGLVVALLDVRAAYCSNDATEHAAARAILIQLIGAALIGLGCLTALCIRTGRVLPAVLCAILFWLSTWAAARFARLEHDWRQRHPQVDG